MIRKLSALAFALALLASATRAQATGHSVTLTWTTADSGTLFNVYRAPGGCPAAAPASPNTPAPFVKLNASPVAVLTYTDTTVTPTTYCYVVTELGAGGTPESNFSNLAGAAIIPSAVTITVVVAK